QISIISLHDALPIVPVQYVRYLGKVAKGDLGISFQFSNTPVSKIIKDRIGPSMQLGFQSLVIGTFLGILLGMIAAIFHNGFLDYGSTLDRKSTRLNSSHVSISYAVFCLKKKIV